MFEELESVNIFHFNKEEGNFEWHSHENGFTHWYGSDLQEFLEYKSNRSFELVISKAMATCNSLRIPIFENFVQAQRMVGDNYVMTDWKLSRFACYLIAMNGDSRKTRVAQAQTYFATLAEAVGDYLEEVEGVERVMIRGEISEKEKSLMATASRAGVNSFPLFQNAGYRGMYNMNLSELKKKKFVPTGRTILDFMGKVELAANLYRITQTEMKIQRNDIKGQKRLERTAENVGRQVRSSMIEINGVKPEDLSPAEDIKKVKKQIKQRNKTLKKMDE